MEIIHSTDGKRLGESIQIIDNVVHFSDGETMPIDKIDLSNGLIHWSNYTLIVRGE